MKFIKPHASTLPINIHNRNSIGLCLRQINEKKKDINFTVRLIELNLIYRIINYILCVSMYIILRCKKYYVYVYTIMHIG